MPYAVTADCANGAERAAAVIRGHTGWRERATKRVAVVTLVGSFCPVTLAHVEALRIARRVLLGESNAEAGRPAGLGVYDLVVGFLCVNAGQRVEAKLSEQGVPAVSEADRRMLLDMVLADPDLSWLSSADQATCDVDWAAPVAEREVQVAKLLRQQFPQHEITHFRLDGADVALRWRAWEHASASERFLCMPRGADTAALLEAMQAAGCAPGSEGYEQGHFVLLPDLGAVGAVSSSLVREALTHGDIPALRGMLHPAVLDWNLRHGPYTKHSSSRRSEAL